MGQKTNPISLRLRVNRDHDSSWFSDYHYTKNVATDLQIRNYLQKAFSRAKLCHIRTVVQHLPNQINVYPKAYNYLQKKRNQRRRGAKHSNIIDKLESVDPFFMTEEAKIENLPGMIKSGSRLLNTTTFWESRKTFSGASTLVKGKGKRAVKKTLSIDLKKQRKNKTRLLHVVQNNHPKMGSYSKSFFNKANFQLAQKKDTVLKQKKNFRQNFGLFRSSRKSISWAKKYMMKLEKHKKLSSSSWTGRLHKAETKVCELKQLKQAWKTPLQALFHSNTLKQKTQTEVRNKIAHKSFRDSIVNNLKKEQKKKE